MSDPICSMSPYLPFLVIEGFPYIFSLLGDYLQINLGCLTSKYFLCEEFAHFVSDLWSRRWCSPRLCCGSALAAAAGLAPPPGGCSRGDTTRISDHQSCETLNTER